MLVHLRRVAPVIFLSILLAGCGRDSEPDVAPDETTASDAESTESTPTPSESASSSALATHSESATSAAPEPDVSQETSDEFFAALDEVVKSFTRFEREYQAAVAVRDAPGILAAARRLRDGFYSFDSRLRTLELSVVQRELNTVLANTGQLIQELDDTAKATSGREARAALRAMNVNKFTTAFSDLAAAIGQH
jgi:hypothetical protein